MKVMEQQNWKPSDGIVLEANAELAVKSNENTLIIAGPGAGKTELLAQKADFLFHTNICRNPQKILAISFKKDSASNLKERIVKRCGKDLGDRFSSYTYDAFAKIMLDHFIGALPKEYRPKSNYEIDQNGSIILSAAEKLGYKIIKDERRAFINYVQNIKLPIENDKIKDIWNLLLNGYDNVEPTLTFGMITNLATYIFHTNPLLKKSLQLTYSHVFLDEFQDTTKAQYELVKECFQYSSSKLTAVGDSKQRIMLWAGALPTVFSDFIEDFSSKQIRLVMNHRSAPKLVELQRSMYDFLNEKSLDVVPSSKWESNSGEIDLIINNNDNEEAELISKFINKKIIGGIQAREICVLTKQKSDEYTSILIKKLNKYNIRARVENAYQDLLKEPIVGLILSLLKCSFFKKDPDSWNEVNQYYDMLNPIPNDQIMFISHIESIKNKINEIKYKGSKVDNIESLNQMFYDVVNFYNADRIKAQFPEYSNGSFFNKVINDFSNLFYEELMLSNKHWENAINGFLGLNSIPIMTIHKSKGLEYNTVIFMGLEDGAFWNYLNQMQEDQCAFFVALSRAKEHIVFSCAKIRTALKFPEQKMENIKDLYLLLAKSNLVTVYNYIEKDKT